MFAYKYLHCAKEPQTYLYALTFVENLDANKKEKICTMIFDMKITTRIVMTIKHKQLNISFALVRN